MLKTIMLLTRKPGLSREQFVQHWTQVHAELARQIPQLRRYVQNLAPPDAASGVDGIAELCFDDAEQRDLFRASPAGKRWIEDGANFLDPNRTVVYAVEENTVVAR